MADARALVVIIGVLHGAVAHALPEDPGSLSVVSSTRTETIAGTSVTFDLYVSQGLAGPAPVVVVGHGLQRSKANMADWGDQLARRGYVAAVPTFPGVLPDHPLNGKILAGLLDWLVNEGGKPGSPLAGQVDGNRRAVVGFSAGGLAAVLAAAGDPEIDVVVGLDPVDSAARGSQAAPQITAPVVFIRAEPGPCNNNGNAATIFASLVGPRMSLVVDQATHCDGESPTGTLCTLFCGGQAPARHQLFRRYAFAALDYHLLCDTGMAPWLAGASAQADSGIKNLIVASFPGAPAGCAAGPDAGPTPDSGPVADGGPDAGVPAADLSVLPDGALPADSGVALSDGRAPGEPSVSSKEGGGCSYGPVGPTPLSAALLLLPLLMRLRR